MGMFTREPGKRIVSFAIVTEYDDYDDRRFTVDLRDFKLHDTVRRYLPESPIINLRDLFNNLDKDDRNDSDYSASEHAGRAVTIAALLYASELVDEDTTRREFLSDIANLDIGEYVDIELNYLIETCMDSLTSYVFGRHVDKDFMNDNPEVYEDMYVLCTDVLYSLLMDLAKAIHKSDDLLRFLDIMESRRGWYPVSYWYSDYLVIDLMTDQDMDIERLLSDIKRLGYER